MKLEKMIKKSDFNIFDDLQLRYPDKSSEEIKEAVEFAGPTLFTNIENVVSLTTKTLQDNMEFMNRVHLKLRGYPLYKQKPKK